jgi:hypothetical protein
MMEATIVAAREGRPYPFPRFVEFCAHLMDEDDRTREPPVEPTMTEVFLDEHALDVAYAG